MGKDSRLRAAKAAQAAEEVQNYKHRFNFVVAPVVVTTAVIAAVSCSALLLHASQSTQVIPKFQVKQMTATAGSRLDQHDGQMKVSSENLMAYQNEDLTGQENHYIIANDWYDIIKSPSFSKFSNAELHYPITVANGHNDTTETHWYDGSAWKKNSDGNAGTFNWGWDEGTWYNVLKPVTYNDDWNDNGGGNYVSIGNGLRASSIDASNNYHATLATSDGNPVMKPVRSSYCYYDHNDYKDADYTWWRDSSHQSIKAADLKQGTNTICCAGTDASGNYTTGSRLFHYDTVAPNDSATEIINVTSSGYDFYVHGVGDATNGVDHMIVYYWDKSGNKHTITLNSGTSSGLWHAAISGGGNNYYTVAYIYDKAGNQTHDSASIPITRHPVPRPAVRRRAQLLPVPRRPPVNQHRVTQRIIR